MLGQVIGRSAVVGRPGVPGVDCDSMSCIRVPVGAGGASAIVQCFTFSMG